MQPTRRLLLSGAAAQAVIPAGVRLADTTARAAGSAHPRMADRASGAASAPKTVTEWFSFTCHFCAHFAADIYPQIKAKYIDTGELRLVFNEYPRDQVDLMAAMVARALPPTRYEPFKDALLATQSHWAFDQTVDSKEELAKMAALAGMPRETFDRVVADTGLRTAILDAQAEAERRYTINSTPTFIYRDKVYTGEAGFSTAGFSRMIDHV